MQIFWPALRHHLNDLNVFDLSAPWECLASATPKKSLGNPQLWIEFIPVENDEDHATFRNVEFETPIIPFAVLPAPIESTWFIMTQR